MTEEDKELAEAKKEIRELLEGLSASQLDTLLGMPLLLEEVLEQAERSPLLAEKLMQLADAEYETLSPPEKAKGRQLIARLLEEEKMSQSQGKVIDDQPKPNASQHKATDKPITRHAASSEHERREDGKN